MQRGLLAAFLLAASTAQADPRSARLDASGACEVTGVELRASELLGRDAFAPDAAARVEVVTSQDGAGVTATLTFTDEHGVAHPARAMSAVTCDELVESIAIVISLVLREDAPPVPAPTAPTPAAAAPTPAAAAPTPAAPPPVPEPPANDALFTPVPPTTVRVLEAGVATSSARHSVLVLGGRLEQRRTALGADLEIAMPEQVDVARGAVHVIGARADVAGCWRVTTSFSACGLVGAGFVRARGEDLMDARVAIRPLASLGLRAEWRQRLSRGVGLRLFATVDQLLVRPSFLVGDVPVWTSPLVQAWLGGGIFFQLP